MLVESIFRHELLPDGEEDLSELFSQLNYNAFDDMAPWGSPAGSRRSSKAREGSRKSETFVDLQEAKIPLNIEGKSIVYYEKLIGYFQALSETMGLQVALFW